jgi:asparagine synthase (glutamine-hydrolysing)
MCGIAGIYNYAEPDRPIDRQLLTAMTRALEHRGPDADGIHIDGPIGLGHRRLSIVDLSPTGAQPMPTQNRGGWIVYNGEFYNHSEFRTRLAQRGIRFRGSSDTETLLYVLHDLGPEALEHAAGIFGFAYWNTRKQELTLGRDPMGVKQVYYHDDGHRLLFASEIKAILVDPSVRREVDPKAVSEYLHFHTPIFERTFFHGIRQVRAGEYLTFNRYRSEARTYWKIGNFQKYDLDANQQVAELAQQINGVVKDQLMADVPVAAFFSGGIDSTAVAAFASGSGGLARCFGVHFANQGVIDERPYQEAAAKALGLNLQLTTLDGSTFPDDIRKLLYFQDQPVIGPAMFPMYAVSRLAASEFKVCLGGQASDEVFGGYARYALARPLSVLRNWFAESTGQHVNQVGGNLSKQLAQRKNLSRLIRNARNLTDWQARYFESFAKVPLPLWRQLFDNEDLFDRQHCRLQFEEETNLSAATDPADKIMEWDVRTYLTGLFQQDDRMSMAVSLESRVPLADPRLVRHAFRIPYDLKFRRGATKWVLREAIADIVPEMVLNRVKVGFDTPVEAWMRGKHAGFVRETLLSKSSLERGFWCPKGMRHLIDHADSAFWLDRIWKALSIEVWANLFLDTKAETSPDASTAPYVLAKREDPVAMAETAHAAEGPRIGNFIREVRELGLVGTLARSSWEFKTRSGLLSVAAGSVKPPASGDLQLNCFQRSALVRDLLAGTDVGPGPALREAVDAAHGRLKAFGSWTADFGQPIAWHVNPVNGRAFHRTPHWSRIYSDQTYTGDIKLAWEAGRFPQCFQYGRASAFHPEAAAELGRAAERQILDFIRANPVNYGVQWASGQEVALRLLAWTYAMDVLPAFDPASMREIAEHVAASAQYIEDHIEYAQRSVYNNHLISEAFGLLLAGLILPGCSDAARWTRVGIEILEKQADRQIYDDGAYISQSHNYERSVLHVYLAAIRLLRSRNMTPPESWLTGLDRACRFLFAQQNPSDGRLPNYGGNDGAMPLILSSCDYSDFRPTLQAVSIAVRGERLYPKGPWDEMAVWLFGEEAMQAPEPGAVHSRAVTVSFASTGYHIVRSDKQNGSFAMLRCGSLKDRFSQIDMLHLDVWWRGENVLVDPGTFLYNGPSEWHAHFYGTGSHNTVSVDGHDQMLHVRKFKCLYPTVARLNRFAPSACGQLFVMQGEHDGYARHPGGCVHRRTVLYARDLDAWIVVDDVIGATPGGLHHARVHWQGADYPHQVLPSHNGMRLATPHGDFSITLYQDGGVPAAATVASGETEPGPRGWISRYYGVKSPAPSLAAECVSPVPLRFVSVLCAAELQQNIHVERGTGDWTVTLGTTCITFGLDDPAHATATAAASTLSAAREEEEPVLL